MANKVIFKQKYSSESLCDVERDVMEAFDSDFNPLVADMEVDEHGFNPGSFTVTIEYDAEDE